MKRLVASVFVLILSTPCVSDVVQVQMFPGFTAFGSFSRISCYGPSYLEMFNRGNDEEEVVEVDFDGGFPGTYTGTVPLHPFTADLYRRQSTVCVEDTDLHNPDYPLIPTSNIYIRETPVVELSEILPPESPSDIR